MPPGQRHAIVSVCCGDEREGPQRGELLGDLRNRTARWFETKPFGEEWMGRQMPRDLLERGEAKSFALVLDENSTEAAPLGERR